MAEYIRQPESFQVKWPEKKDVDALLHEMRQMQNDPVAWVPESQLRMLSGARIVEADLCSVDRFNDTPLYRHAQPATVVPGEMTAEMMRAVQLNSELGAFVVANMSGAYDLFAEFWKVACRAGITDEQLAEAVAEKLKRNKRLALGEVKDGEPCHHVKN